MKTVSTDKAPAAIGPYSQAQIVGNLVYTSGQIPIDPATGLIAEGLEAQANQVFKNIAKLLAEKKYVILLWLIGQSFTKYIYKPQKL